LAIGLSVAEANRHDVPAPTIPWRPTVGTFANRCTSLKLSILMPVYNEAPTVLEAITCVLDVSYPCDRELVLVDDGSTDRTATLLAGIGDPRVSVGWHEQNRGKGAAIRTAAAAASGDFMIVCDADLEYSPEEIPALLRPILHYRARGRELGKKITWTDGIVALWIIMKIRAFWRPRSRQ
jgi:glycosyltransferase involved in cell wall biosynthesis